MVAKYITWQSPLQNTYSVAHLAHGLFMSFRCTPLMVAEYGDHAVSVVVRIQLLLNRSILRRALVQLLLEGYGCIVGTKHLGSQALHVRCKVFVQRSRLRMLSVLILCQRAQLQIYVDAIKQVVTFFLIILEQANVFEHLWLNGNAVVIPNRVFTEEIKDNEIGSLQRDMFAAQRATTDRICFIFPFLVTRTKSQSIDEIHCGRPLSVGHNFTLQVGLIICADSGDVILTRSKCLASEMILFLYLEFTSFLKLRHVTLALQRATRGQKYILVVAVDIFHPVSKPGHGFIVHQSFPAPGHVGDRNGNPLANVNGDIFGANTELSRTLVASLPPMSQVNGASYF